MNSICIIPARGGSKGHPRKNVLPLCGRPLIAWNILAALEACGEGNVYVSTDDAEIAAIGEKYGARIVWRPAELSVDQASSESALIHALEKITNERSGLPEFFLFMQCTSPLTAAKDLSAVCNALQSGGADSVFSATSSHRFLWKRDPENSATGINHDSTVRLRRQDMDPEYAENGAIYGMRTQGFLDSKHRFFGKTLIHVMPEQRSWEIDSPTDFKIAEVLLREQLKLKLTHLLPTTISAVVFDFDGVMTDNRVHTGQDGGETVACDRSDGLGLAALRKAGIRLQVLSTEVNSVVSARCNKLNIPCIHGVEDKASRLKQWLADEKIDSANVIYVGNDRNDSGCLELVGCPVVVADAYPEAMQRALIVLERKGGQGAVRELCDMILDAKF
ncbi:MAG: cytidylyltransferase domain-containing protein [Luteolibacter sp.]